MNYVRKLGFEETPDYDFLRELFTKVLKTLNEPEDGVFDWMLINGGKGWEASAVCVHYLIIESRIDFLSAQNAATPSPQTPHREHRRERDHGAHRRASRQVQDNVTPSTPLVISPPPAHVKGSRRADRGNSSRDIGSVQPLAPASRRVSQQQREANALSSAGLSPHPYASAPSPIPYRSSSAIGGYGRHSPNPVNALPNGNGHLNGSDTYLFGQTVGKTGTNSRETTTAGTTTKDVSGIRAMGVYDREQMQRVGEQDEDGGHGRRRGLWAAFCCRHDPTVAFLLGVLEMPLGIIELLVSFIQPFKFSVAHLGSRLCRLRKTNFQFI
jgi:casein kinase 1